MTRDYTTCSYCRERRDCTVLYGEKFLDICDDCYEEHVRPCPTCNDVVIDGKDGETCWFCWVFFPAEEGVTPCTRA